MGSIWLGLDTYLLTNLHGKHYEFSSLWGKYNACATWLILLRIWIGPQKLGGNFLNLIRLIIQAISCYFQNTSSRRQILSKFGLAQNLDLTYAPHIHCLAPDSLCISSTIWFKLSISELGVARNIGVWQFSPYKAWNGFNHWL